MSAAKNFYLLFQQEKLQETFLDGKSIKSSIGLDKISYDKFKLDLESNCEIISRKVFNNSYTFTRYREILISKGKNKVPRIINIPTIRDKLTLTMLNKLIHSTFGKCSKSKLPQIIIEEIASELDNYEVFLKFDIKSFYGSIDHELLFRKISYKIRKKEIKDLIQKSIKTESLSLAGIAHLDPTNREIGLPEGIPISNSLANIFMLDFDNHFNCDKSIKYWRYVDDILILSSEKNITRIKNNIVESFSKLNLSLNDKCSTGNIDEAFDYLGYLFSPSKISVRSSSIRRLEAQLDKLISTNKHAKPSLLQWKLNNKITGFIVSDKKYGWLFYFSQLTDMSILFHLDNVVYKILNRFNLKDKINPKRFVRAYHEITKSLHSTTYLTNYDFYSFDQKKALLFDIFGIKSMQWSTQQVNFEFSRLLINEIKDIEKDLEDFS